MTILPLALLLTLSAAPAGPACDGERLTLLPFDAVALPRPEVRQTEDMVRRAIARTPGVCLEPREETVKRLRALGERPAPCADPACRSTQVTSLGARWMARGHVLGLGGERTVSVVLVGLDGRETRSTFPVPAVDAEEAAARAFKALWEKRGASSARKTLKPWPQILIATGAAALVAGVGFGVAARSTERRLSTGAGGCTGEAEAYRRCFASGLRRGDRQATTANALLGAGAVLSAGGAILFVWELP